jgi:hypothetical protein
LTEEATKEGDNDAARTEKLTEEASKEGYNESKS